MASPSIGHKTQASFGYETTPGTPVSPRTVGMRVSSVDLAPHSKVSGIKTLTGDGVVGVVSDFLQESVEVTGNIKAPACFQGGNLGFLLELAMGTGSCTDAGAGPYTHTYAVAPTQDCATIAIERGDTGYDEVVSGCKLSKLAISVQPGQVAEVSADFTGMTYASRAAVARITPATAFYVKHNHVGSVSFNSVSYVASSLTVTIDRKISTLFELGSLTSGEPVQTDHIECMVEAEFVVRGENTLQAAANAVTSADLTCTISDGTRSLALTLYGATITDHSDPISSIGVIKQKVKWMGKGDGTNHGIGFVLTNANATPRLS